METKTQKKRSIRPVQIAFIFAALGFFLVARAVHLEVSRSSSSTAAVAYIGIPFIGAPLAMLGFIFGYCLPDLIRGFRGRLHTRHGNLGGLRATVAMLMLGYVIYFTVHGILLSNTVKRIQSMSGTEISTFSERSVFRKNIQAVDAMARNPNTQGQTLRQILQMAHSFKDDNMSLEWFLTGRSFSKECAMRSIARHENITADSLSLVANHLNKYGLRTVAKNPKTPEETLRRLAATGGYSIEVGLAANTNTPADMLTQLAKNTERYVRRSVAGNPGTPARVREILGNDPDQQVRAAVERYLQKNKPNIAVAR